MFGEHLSVSRGLSHRHPRRRLADDELDEGLDMDPPPTGVAKRVRGLLQTSRQAVEDQQSMERKGKWSRHSSESAASRVSTGKDEATRVDTESDEGTSSEPRIDF